MKKKITYKKGQLAVFKPQQAVVSLVDQVSEDLWEVEFTNGERAFANSKQLRSL